MPLTPTFQSAFQSAYRSGFTHNAGVFNSKRLDLSTNHDSSDTTISDRSPYGNDATLKSGVYFSTNGLTDKGINADCSAAGSGTYKLTGKVRSASTGTKYVTMDGATGDTLTVNTADVWEDFESTEFTGTPSNVVMGWDGGSNFSACDWSDIRLIDTSDGSTVARWQGNDSGASDLDGKLVADSSGNGYHGAHIDCAGGSGEGTILQTAGTDWNRGQNSLKYSEDFASWGGGSGITFTPTVIDGPDGNDVTAILALKSVGTGRSFNISGVASSTGRYWYIWLRATGTDVQNSFTEFRFGGVNPTGVIVSGPGTISEGTNVQWEKITGLSTTEWTLVRLTASGATERAISCGSIFDGTSASVYIYQARETDSTDPDAYVYYPTGNASNIETVLIPKSPTTAGQDVIGNPITNPRPNNKVINLIADDAKATVAADASMDVTKTIEGWVYYDGTDQTFLDIGTPIINSSSDVLGSTLAGSLTYYVNGAATTALGSAGWKYIVIASDTAQATDAIDILATSAAWKFIDRTLSAAEVLARFNTTKAQYGF